METNLRTTNLSRVLGTNNQFIITILCKMLLTLFCFVGEMSGCFAQTTFKIGSTSDEIGFSIATDVSGNVYVTGYFIGTVDFDPGPGTQNLISNSGSYDNFVAKYNSAGIYQWAFQLGSSSNESAGYGIAVDGSNVYVTGGFLGTIDFDPGPGTQNLTSNAISDIYIAKYTSAGAYVWAFNYGGSSNSDEGYDLAVDGSGNVYVTGAFQNSPDFDPGPGTAILTAGTPKDIFVAKYNSAGAYVWAFDIGAGGSDYGFSIALDGSSNVYVTGYFWNTADFDPSAGTVNLTSNGNEDIFVAKYNSAGTYQWAFNIGSTAQDIGYALAVDNSSNVYVTGVFRGTVDFDPVGTANLTSNGSGDIFVAKYNSAGAYQWAFNAGSALNDYGRGLAVDEFSSVYVMGGFQGTVDFDPIGTANFTSNGSVDIFVAKYNSAGAYQWAFNAGSTSNDVGWSIAYNGLAYVNVTGYFQNTVDFDPSAGTFNLTSAGSADIFVAKYDINGQFLPIELLSFDAAVLDGKKILLEWQTATEINNDYFTIERSTPSSQFPTLNSFEQIGTVKGAGNSFIIQNYSFVDNTPPSDIIYYRLKQTDYDGKYTYSGIVPVYLSLQGINITNISSNLSENKLEYLINSSEDTKVEIKAIDMLGKNVMNQTVFIQKGENKQTLDISNLNTGMYVLQITTESKLYKEYRQFVKGEK